MDKLTIEKQQTPDGIVFLLEGAVDTNTSPKLESELLAVFDDAKAVDIDLEKVRYISSSGLRVLLAALKKSKSDGVPLRLLHLSQENQELFDMVGFTEFFTIV